MTGKRNRFFGDAQCKQQTAQCILDTKETGVLSDTATDPSHQPNINYRARKRYVMDLKKGTVLESEESNQNNGRTNTPVGSSRRRGSAGSFV